MTPSSRVSRWLSSAAQHAQQGAAEVKSVQQPSAGQVGCRLEFRRTRRNCLTAPLRCSRRELLPAAQTFAHRCEMPDPGLHCSPALGPHL